MRYQDFTLFNGFGTSVLKPIAFFSVTDVVSAGEKSLVRVLRFLQCLDLEVTPWSRISPVGNLADVSKECNIEDRCKSCQAMAVCCPFCVLLHILHTLGSKWVHSHSSKLHKSEQKLFIVTGRWYCRQKCPLTLWKCGCDGLTEADFFFSSC